MEWPRTTLPVSALFRSGDVWSLFVVEDGRARLRQIEVGQRTPLTAEIKGGVEADEEVIIHPANEITDGTRVEPREQEFQVSLSHRAQALAQLKRS